MPQSAARPSEADLRRIEEELDTELQFRPLARSGELLVGGLLVTLSLFHLSTAGFGLLREDLHRGVHLAFVIGLIFLVFGFRKPEKGKVPKSSVLAPGGVPLLDWLCAGAAAVTALYIPFIFHDLACRVGNHLTVDMGTVLLVLSVEATRRAIGWACC